MKAVLFGVYPDKIQVQQTYMAGDFISVHVLAPGPGYNKNGTQNMWDGGQFWHRKKVKSNKVGKIKGGALPGHLLPASERLVAVSLPTMCDYDLFK